MKNAPMRDHPHGAPKSSGDNKIARAGATPSISEAASLAQSPDKLLEIFRERCGARALMTAEGWGSLQYAVDQLWGSAVHQGLVDHFGADAIQAVMAEAFGNGGQSWIK